MGKNVKAQKPEKVSSLKGIAAVSKGIGKKANSNANQNAKNKPKKQYQKPTTQPPIQNGKVKKTKQEKSATKPEKKEKVNNKTQIKLQKAGVPKQNKAKPKPANKNAEKENVESPVTVLKLTKRSKNRAKAEIKKEIILKGKSTEVLSTPKVVKKKLAKLEAKPEPRSVKAQKKILLLKSILDRLEKENESPKKVDGEKKIVATNGVKPITKKVKTKINGSDKFPKNDFVIFVGRLNPSITLDMLREHFKSAGEVQRVTLPEPKKRKSRCFAYIQFDSEESRQKALKLHESMIGECKINVLYANKGRNKKVLAKQNAKLNSKRKAELTDTQVMEVGKLLKIKNKTSKKKPLVKKK